MNIYRDTVSAERNIYAVRSFPIFIVVSLFFFGCTSSPRFTAAGMSEPTVKRSAPESTASSSRPKTTEGIVSFYAHDFHGKKTANGEQYDMHAMTAAHRSYPFNTKVRVTHLENGKSVVVRINDRGPFKLERIADLSLGAAEALGMKESGTAKVRLEVLEWGPE